MPALHYFSNVTVFGCNYFFLRSTCWSCFLPCSTRLSMSAPCSACGLFQWSEVSSINLWWFFRMQRPIFVTFPLSTEENESLASLTRFTLVSRASRSKANVPRRHFEFNFFNSYYGMLRGQISMNLSLMDPMIAIWNNRLQNGRHTLQANRR